MFPMRVSDIINQQFMQNPPRGKTPGFDPNNPSREEMAAEMGGFDPNHGAMQPMPKKPMPQAVGDNVNQAIEAARSEVAPEPAPAMPPRRTALPKARATQTGSGLTPAQQGIIDGLRAKGLHQQADAMETKWLGQ